jgi:hypothetical protein
MAVLTLVSLWLKLARALFALPSQVAPCSTKLRSRLILLKMILAVADTWENFVDKVISGIPGQNKFANIPDKVDDTGNVLANPGALPLAAGASSTVQNKGVQETGKENDQTNSTIQSMADIGAFTDPNLKAVIAGDKKTKQIYDKIAAGKQASPDEIKKLQEAMVKGVSTTGEDTAYLEKEQYDTNIAALSMKRQLMADDPTTKPSEP